MIETSVIIPAYGHCPHLTELVRALLDGDQLPGEIIVSHSGAGDPTETLAAVSEGVTVLHHPGRLFAGPARNRGAAVARGEWLAFIDADVQPRPDWLKALMASARAASRRFVVGSVGCATTGGYWGMCNWLCELSEQAPWLPARHQTGGASCNMIVRAEDFREVGGFPEDHLGGEDTMLFRRLRSIGRQQWFEPAAHVGHHNRSGLGAFARHQYQLGYHNALVRQRIALPGNIATRIRLFALGLWNPRLGLIGKRVFAGGPAWWLRGAGFAPGIIVGTWIWTAGFLKRVFEHSPGEKAQIGNSHAG